MDRRLFLTGLLGLAGAAAVAGATRPTQALAGVPRGNGILDELDADTIGFDGDAGTAGVLDVQYRRRDHWHRPPPRRRRRVWRRVCRSYWRHGRRRVRCWRERVWIWR